jgi:quinol monooxygenase YgiN
MSIKQERLEDFLQTAKSMTSSTHAEDKGCIAYQFLQQADAPTLAVLYEQWTDQQALDSHVARLVRDMGQPLSDESLPASHHRRRLPASFISLFDKTEAIRYDVLS